MTMTPWDGVWTEELLRDLTGGVTRSEGKLVVRIGYYDETVRRYRDALGNRYAISCTVEDEVDGVMTPVNRVITCPPWDAVDELNQRRAVPVNDDGRPWKVQRPDEACC